jgi:glycosyltransferase involved in cell wall biosynthesis
MGSVSVLVNSYNRGRFVVEAIESALEQSLPPLEVIVVDDGSTDDTLGILMERYAGHSVVKILHQRNSGQVAAFVLGMEQAAGELIFFLDADDKYERNHLEEVTRVLAEHRDVGFIFTAHRKFGDADDVVQYAPENLNMGFSAIATLKSRIYIGSITSTLAIRRGIGIALLPVLRQIMPRWRTRGDDALIYGSSLAGAKKYYVAAPTVLYRLHATNDHRIGAVTRQDEFYAHGLRRDSFLELLAQHLGLGPSVRLHVAWEFLSIERPTRNQYREYVRLNWRFRESLLRALKGRIKIYLHYKRNRPAWDVATPASFHG